MTTHVIPTIFTEEPQISRILPEITTVQGMINYETIRRTCFNFHQWTYCICTTQERSYTWHVHPTYTELLYREFTKTHHLKTYAEIINEEMIANLCHTASSICFSASIATFIKETTKYSMLNIRCSLILLKHLVQQHCLRFGDENQENSQFLLSDILGKLRKSVIQLGSDSTGVKEWSVWLQADW